MNREIALDMRAGRGDAVVETRYDCSPMDSVSTDATVKMVVGVGIVAEHQSAERRRTPVSPDTAEGKLGEFPLPTDISFLGAAIDLPVLTPGELRIDVQSRVD